MKKIKLITFVVVFVFGCMVWAFIGCKATDRYLAGLPAPEPPTAGVNVTNLVVLSINVVSNFYTYSLVPPEKGDTNSATTFVKMKPDWTIHTNVSIGYFDGTNAIEVFKVRWD